MKDKSDVLVSLRLPVSMAEELGLLLRKKHFVTVSEAIRSIIREKYLEDSERSGKRLIDELKKLRESIEK